MLVEERFQFIEWDEVHSIVKIDVTGAFDPVQLFRLGRLGECQFTEFLGVSPVAADEQQWARRNRIEVLKRVEVHASMTATPQRSSMRSIIVTPV